jgi:hypothetical protein
MEPIPPGFASTWPSTRPLWQEAPLIVSSLLGTTAHRAGEVASMLAGLFADKAAKAERALKMTQERSAFIRQAIRIAIGKNPFAWESAQHIQNRIARDPGSYGIGVPDLSVIRDEWQRCKETWRLQH